MTNSIEDFSEIMQRDVPLSRHTWLGTGGPAEMLFTPRTREEVIGVAQACLKDGIPVRILGSGSNLLVRDAGVKGAVIRVVEPLLSEVTVDENQVTAEGGALLSHVVSEAVRGGLGGMEHLVGIPGTIGAAIIGNSGGRLGDIGQIVTSVSVLTQAGELTTRKEDELQFTYRNSNLQDLILLSATLSLTPDDSDELTRRMRKNWILKRATQPLADQSAGCIFRNPRGLSAGALIEQSGLKGLSVGKARVSDRHANFIVTEAGCSSDDVERLSERIQNVVEEKFGVELKLEIQVW
jgi:UDP-N-acetylmuramate dehydrogenase